MVLESAMYPTVEDWLQANFSEKKYDLEVIPRGTICYEPLRAQIDVIAIKYELFKNQEPWQRRITDIYVVECKKNPWSYGGYGQLLFYKTIFELYRNSDHWDYFNDDFFYGPKAFYKKHGRLPKGWANRTLGEGKFIEFHTDQIYVHFFIALYHPTERQMYGRWEDALNAVKNILSVFKDSKVSFGLLWIESDFSKCHEEPSEQYPIVLSSKHKPEQYFDAEEAMLLPYHKTLLYCKLFTHEGKRTGECNVSKGQKPSPQNCRYCNFYRRIR